MNSGSGPARYIMLGGFLGAGKTTAIDQFARILSGRGARVGLITNDQSEGLVDTGLLRAKGHTVEEITGGCFCCRFDSLREAADALSAQARPEVFLAEPVGSCTDLMATVSYPLRRMYGDQFRIAPLSVLVDPRRVGRVLGLREGRAFSEKVVYVYRKQLEEADLIVLNKCDTLAEAEQSELEAALRRAFPQAELLRVSAKTGQGIEAWVDRVLAAEGSARPTMELDYDEYAEGEALLGWLNATLSLDAPEPVDGNALVLRMGEALREGIAAAGGEIAHCKLTLDHRGQLSVVSLVSNEDQVDLRESLLDQVPGGSLTVNLRAEMDPELLSRVLHQVIAAENALGSAHRLRVEHEEHFRPARPVPTHRDSVS